ncbi:MAG TPA: TIGR03435 family protein [Vicinamibacterales bacterium]|nr:TIGR03435 family protein [Vicinamibacterales bacterium]
MTRPVLFAAVTLLSAVISAQTVPSFEAASIKVNKSSDAGGSFGVRPGQVRVTNYTLRDIVRNAYGLQRYQIVGGPAWLAEDRFDIVAKAPDGATQPQLQQMVQTLLGDRFKLRVHRERRDIPIFALVAARADRRLGPKMTPAAYDCPAANAARARGETPAPQPAPVGDRPVCGARTNPGRMLVGGYAVADFVRNLGGFAGRPVVDRTGLTGAFDFELTWTPDEPPPPGVQPPPWYDPNGPSLQAAVQEQLGLKLEAMTGPYEVLVIDSAERPTEN